MTGLQYLLGRLKEPSTWAGIAALLGLLHVQIPLVQFQAAVPALTVLAGLAAILIQEGQPAAAAGATAPHPAEPSLTAPRPVGTTAGD